MSITNINQQSIQITQQETYTKKGDREAYGQVTTASITSSESVVYDPSQPKDTQYVTDNGYTVDMDKIHAMKEENEQRMVDLFRETVKGGSLKQIGGLRGFIDKIRSSLSNGDTTIAGLSIEINIEITEVTVAKAEEETSANGYWGAEQTSERFLDFAKALSGNDPSKADMLLQAVKDGYDAAEEIWGSALPELSQNTLALTIEKFDAWRDGSDVAAQVE